MTLDFDTLDSPVGRLDLYARDGRLCALELQGSSHPVREWLENRFGAFATRVVRDPAGARTALAAYFEGDLTALDRVQTDPGGTPFQRRVWDALRAIPVGTTVTYSEIAARVGSPGAARAAGGANACNPVAIVVPCHRVVAAGGKLGGYAGGLGMKRWLLEHEGVGQPA
jgi:methylated-DNA-[protein]-cysteine S-methyltransferase